ncbi:MAG: hypothetical protein COB93_06745 [Sneathiella sp.]|nr:MAG: hypothetical protein COB93_06745 [Sneathiella sp.]
MSDRLKQIEAFLRIAETQNFTRAGGLMGLSQPALSLLMSQFEEEIGLKLFHRTTRSVELSKAGLEFLPNAIRISQDVDNSLESLRQTAAVLRGSVHVVSLPSLCSSLLASCVKDFKQSFPEIDMKVEEMAAGPIADAIASGQCDFGIGVLLEERENIRFVPLFMDKLVLLCTEASPFANKETVQWVDLKSEPMVLMNAVSSVRNLINAACLQNNMVLRNAFEVNFMSTAISFVRAGLGMTILPTTALADFVLDGIRILNIENPVLERSIGLLQRADRLLSPAATQFAKNIRELRTSPLDMDADE